MSNWTKQGLIEEAYSEMGLAFYNFDLDPEELQTGMRRMDAMAAQWEQKGIRVSYRFGGTLSDDSGLPDGAVEAFVCHLAIRLAPGKGKTIPPDTRARADEGYLSLARAAAMPQQQQLRPTLPMGAGNKPWSRGTYGRFYPTPDTSPMQVGPSGDLDILE